MSNTYGTDWAQHQHDLDNGHRANVIQGLKDLARYLETHENIPVPWTVDVHHAILADTDEAGEDEVIRIADTLATRVSGSDEIATASLGFGPVSYSATYVSREQMAEYNAHMAEYHAKRPASAA